MLILDQVDMKIEYEVQSGKNGGPGGIGGSSYVCDILQEILKSFVMDLVVVIVEKDSKVSSEATDLELYQHLFSDQKAIVANTLSGE